MNVLQELHILADADYRLFQSRLMPGSDPDRILGVRTGLRFAQERSAGSMDPPQSHPKSL